MLTKIEAIEILQPEKKKKKIARPIAAGADLGTLPDWTHTWNQANIRMCDLFNEKSDEPNVKIWEKFRISFFRGKELIFFFKHIYEGDILHSRHRNGRRI